MLTERVDEELLEAAGPQLRIVANHAVGFDNVDLEACTAAGVLATNTPDVLTETTADTAFALIMAAARRVGEGERFLRARTPWIWGPLMMLGQDVHHKTIGIVGFGRIGQAVARRARGFGMRVLYADAVQLPQEVETETGAERRELDDLLAEADVVSMHAAVTPDTVRLISAERIARMKPGAVYVNSARAALHDLDALTAALQSGRLAAAALDHFEGESLATDHPLVAMPNVILTPHIGGATYDVETNHTLLMADGLDSLLRGEAPLNLANPEVLDG